MVPTGLTLGQVGIEDIAAVVVETGDEMPFGPSRGSPEVMRAVVLDELTNIVGQNLAGVSPPDWLTEIETSGLGLPDDCWNGDSLPVLIAEPVPNIGVVITPEFDLGIKNELFFDPKFTEDVFLDLRSDAMRGVTTAIVDREPLWILLVTIEQSKDSAAADLEDGGQMGKLDLLASIPSKKIPDLGVPEGLVKLFGHRYTSLQFWRYIPTFWRSPLLNFKCPKNSPLLKFK